jgi:hypothetical protein
MKTLARVIAVLAVIHILALGGGVGWLVSTDRLNRDRAERIVDMIATTIEEAEQQRQAEAAKEAEKQAERERQERIANIGKSGSAAEQLAEQRKQNEVLLRRLERTRSEIQVLRDSLALARRRMEEQRDKLVDQKEALEQRLASIEERLNDEGFKRAVELYESIPPDQAKRMFLQLMDRRETDQVVMYLEAMQPRKAAGVLREFEQGPEIVRAVELTERLRARGSDLVEQVESTG